MEALNCCHNEIWDPNEAIIFLQSQTPSNADLGVERLLSGDEHGVQGRVEQHIGQVMTAVCRAKGFGLAFGDCKSSVDTINGKVPDLVCIDK